MLALVNTGYDKVCYREFFQFMFQEQARPSGCGRGQNLHTIRVHMKALRQRRTVGPNVLQCSCPNGRTASHGPLLTVLKCGCGLHLRTIKYCSFEDAIVPPPRKRLYLGQTSAVDC